MNQAVKHLFTFAFALVFVAGTAFAQQTPVTSPVTTVTTNTATAENYGDDNDLTIHQTGLTNEAFIRQGEDGGHTVNNNTSSITQVGNTNFGKITSRKWAGWEPSGAENTITQTGNYNWAKTIAGTQSFGDLAFTKIDQTGDYNWAEQDQNRSERDGDLVIEQTSYGATAQNSGGAGQTLGGASEGNYAYQDMDQNGTGGYAEAIQDGNGNYSVQMIRRGTSEIYQLGNSNWARNDQNGNMDFADFDQDGDGNIIDLKQSGNASATILQMGDGNGVFGLGGAGTVGSSLNGSSLMVDQLGDGNVLKLDQTDGASATVMQDGMTNTSEVVQN
jgi:hypothetical protein